MKELKLPKIQPPAAKPVVLGKVGRHKPAPAPKVLPVKAKPVPPLNLSGAGACKTSVPPLKGVPLQAGCKPDLPPNLSNYTVYLAGGWTAMTRTYEYDEDTTLLEIYDWFGGEGDKPEELGYIYEGGITQDPAEAASGGGNVKGRRGPKGEDGKDGAGLNIIGRLDDPQDLPTEGAPGDAYIIGEDLYIWDSTTDSWFNVGVFQGPPGREVEIGATDTHLVWRYVGDEDWENITPLSELVGPKGPTGDSIELRVDSGFIQWKPTGDSTWNLLIPISDLEGEQGVPGYRGWNYILANILHGDRIVQRVVDWFGGEGPKPPTGMYIGPSGYVVSPDDAVDIRGAKGERGGSGEWVEVTPDDPFVLEWGEEMRNKYGPGGTFILFLLDDDGEYSEQVVPTYASFNGGGLVEYRFYTGGHSGRLFVTGGGGSFDLAVENPTRYTIDLSSTTGATVTLPASGPSQAGLQSSDDWSLINEVAPKSLIGRDNGLGRMEEIGMGVGLEIVSGDIRVSQAITELLSTMQGQIQDLTNRVEALENE